MLKTLKKYQKFNKPFYGINIEEHYGFLMNKFKTYMIIEQKYSSRAKPAYQFHLYK